MAVLTRLRWWSSIGGRVPPSVAVLFLAYLLLVLLGATTSSLGIKALRQDPSHPLGISIGTPQTIRSDEWLTEAPLELGAMASGGTDIGSPLAQHIDLIHQIPTAGIIGPIVFFDGEGLKLGRYFSQAMVFSAYRWLPFLLLLLFLPLLLEQVGSTRPLAWFATAVFVLSPVCAWWSFMPVRIVGFAAAGCYLLVQAVSRYQQGRWIPAGLSAVGAAVLLARLPTYYVPWSITIALPLLLTTIVWLLFPSDTRRSALVVIGAVGLVTLLLVLGLFWENLAALRAELHTVYPGQRRSGGHWQSWGQLFGAPSLFDLQRAPALSLTNSSEITSGFTLCAVWLAVLMGRMHGVFRGRKGAATATLTACSLLWLSWATIDMDGLGQGIPLLNLVPPSRAAQTVGLVLVLLLPLVLSRYIPATPRWRTPAISAGLAAMVTLIGGLGLRFSQIKDLSVTSIVVATSAVLILVLLLTRFNGRRWPLWLALLVVAVPAVRVNPITFGLGDLRQSTAAERMLAEGAAARADGTWWATDSPFTDALLIATGVPSLSGHQVTGPVRSEWEKLDPTDHAELSWNRGASYIWMRWTVGRSLRIEPNPPSPDVIVVSSDPCDPVWAKFHLGHVLSSTRLGSICLVERGSVVWQGTPKFIYEVERR